MPVEASAFERDPSQPAGEVAIEQTDAIESPPPAGVSGPGRAALALFVALLVAAAPTILVLGHDRWFILDDWDFLEHRRLGSFADLMRPHNANHWSTLPIIAWRTMYGLVGLHHYWHYQLMVVTLHLTAVVLLRLVMRRAGVGPWTATLTASLLLLFGAGQSNIVNAFQIGFVGSFVFGLTQLVLADHDGPWDRRDWLGLAAGAAGLMCSGIGVTMVVVVGASVWMRRGLRAAAGHVIPLATLYLVWWFAEGRPTGDSAASAPFTHVAVKVLGWNVSGTLGAFEALGHYTPVGTALAVVLVIGLVLAFGPGGSSRWRGEGAPVLALLGGALLFLTISGWGRWPFGADYSRQSRYLYLFVAFVLPALGVAVQAIGRRWPVALPTLLALLLVGVPGNVSEFGNGPSSGPVFLANRQLVLSLADSPLARHLPPGLEPLPHHDPGLTIGWLVQAKADGKLSAPETLPPQVRGQIPLALGFAPVAGAGIPLLRCQTGVSVRIQPARGSFARIGFGAITIRNRDDATRAWSLPLSYNTPPFFGSVFRAQVDHLDLVVRSGIRGRPVTVCD